jgi:hypothetical protein
LVTAVLVAVSCFASGAYAQECGPLQRVTALDMGSSPGGGPRVTVPIVINGVTKQFIVDTGVRISRLTDKTVTSLGIKPVSSRVKMLYSSGISSNTTYASVDIGIGPISAKGFEVLIEPNANAAADGFLGPDLMANFDVEMDFGGRKLNYFLPNHCEGRVVYWPASAVAVVPYRGWAVDSGDAAMKLPVMLDGHEVIAKVDTGQVRTTLDADTARELFSLTPDSPGAVPLGTIAGEPDHKIFGWVLRNLRSAMLPSITHAFRSLRT